MQHSIGQLDWLDGMTDEAPSCPACGSTSPKRRILETASAIPQKRAVPMQLVSCPECRTRYWTDLSSFHYEDSTGYSWGNRFYVEQGASIDGLIEPIARLPVATVGSCLEIGCGFGFSLDAGRVLFGWRTVGVDPSPLARAGRAALNLDIRPIYADADTELGGPFDVVYASEVIEHVADPHGFLRICRAHLAPRGILILTTPDGDAIRPDVPASALMPILAPGHHLVLFTGESLQRVARAAGFAFTQIVPREYGLVLYAADHPLEIDGSATLDRALFRSYLTAALARPNCPADLRTGLRYRLFKELVNAAEHGAALALFDTLAQDCRQRFGLELKPETAIALEPTIRAGRRLDNFGAPFCLPGLLFFRGVIALNASAAPGEASAWFDAAARIAAAFRAAYQEIGVDDGETGTIEREAPALALVALCHKEPGQAVDRLEVFPGRNAALTETITFTLLDLGALEHAARAAALSADPSLAGLAEGVACLVEGRNAEAHQALATALERDGRVGSRARSADILALAAIEPAGVLALAHRWSLPPATLSSLFIRLTDLGHLTEATTIEPMIEQLEGWDLLAHRGKLALLIGREMAQVADLFGKAAIGAPTPAIWDFKYQEFFARIVAADAIAAQRAAGEILAAGAAVPREIRDKVAKLLEEHPAVRPENI